MKSIGVSTIHQVERPRWKDILHKNNVCDQTHIVFIFYLTEKTRNSPIRRMTVNGISTLFYKKKLLLCLS